MGDRKYGRTIEHIQGVGPATARKLRMAGYVGALDIALAAPEELAEACEIGERKAMNIIEDAKLCARIGRCETKEGTAAGIENVERLTTGSEAFDELMGGGLESQSIVKLFGKSRSSNTRLCHQFAVNATLPKEKGGFDSDVIIINSREDMFDPNLITSMAERSGADPQEVLKRIHVTSALNTRHQMLLVEKAAEMAKENNVKLMIVDSLTSHFKNEYKWRGELSERQETLNRHMNELLDFATMNNAVVVVTNGVASSPIRPWGGHIVTYYATFLLYVVKEKDGMMRIILVDSPDLPEGEVTIGGSG